MRRFTRHPRLVKLSAVLFMLIALTVVWARLQPHPALSTFQSRSVAVFDRHGELLRLSLARDDRYRLWVPISDISPILIEAVLLQEDQWFYWHAGFNPWSLCRGAWISYVLKGQRQGGSTLTMQLARLLWRIDTRTPYGKMRQIARAIQLEINYSKTHILEAYLNYAPYGGNIEGAGTASLIYFGKTPAKLSLAEALTLAVLPQNPNQRSLSRNAKANAFMNDNLRAARDRLFKSWIAQHPTDSQQLAQIALPLPLHSIQSLPFGAPHFVDRVLNERNRRADPNQYALVTTLDANLQRLIERRLAMYLARASKRGIDNAAILLLDSRSMAVRASIGSADYFNAQIEGQVNGTLAKRSPGSTLKPFIYALGIDQGVLHPATVLRDVPTAFGPFTPENFDGRFVGPITATEALIRSRNIPAVVVAAQLQKPNFYQFLSEAKIARMASEQHYGLALVLGGGEVTAEELARMYAMLSHDGLFRSIRVLESEPLDQGQALLSAEASYMVRDMLRQNIRPDLASAAHITHLPVAWKTGTSWGFHDAWTVGIVGPYVLVVWLGHFDGSSNPSLIGVDAAAPLFFEIIDALHATRTDLSEPPRRWPLNLKRIEICLASGNLPNQWCAQRGNTWFIPGKSPIRMSTIHRAVIIDKKTGLPTCGPLPAHQIKKEIYEYWPSDLARVFVQAGIPRRSPPINPACPNGGMYWGSAPRIQSPLHTTTYAFRLNRGEQSHIVFQATADADVRKLHWFVDNYYVGEAKPSEHLDWVPKQPGQYEIRVVDDQGRTDTRMLDVSIVQ